jgi:phosphatidate cytidylyltransferase
MLAKRVLVTLVLLPIGLGMILLGGRIFAAFVALVMGLAAWEYQNLFRAGGLQPAGFLLIGGAVILVLGREFDGFASAGWIISLLVLFCMAYHLATYEAGRDQAGTDFSVTLSGALYIGWLGAYLVSLRSLPDGKWWLLLALPCVWLADSTAYLIGSRFGRHKMNRRLSPRKSWEGYLSGILAATIGGALLAFVYGAAGAGPAITPRRGAFLGLALSITTVLGDLGESLIKRQVGAKDSGNLLPGHGGVFDRIDSWLWAGVISYYMIVWLF